MVVVGQGSGDDRVPDVPGHQRQGDRAPAAEWRPAGGGPLFRGIHSFRPRHRVRERRQRQAPHAGWFPAGLAGDQGPRRPRQRHGLHLLLRGRRRLHGRGRARRDPLHELRGLSPTSCIAGGGVRVRDEGPGRRAHPLLGRHGAPELAAPRRDRHGSAPRTRWSGATPSPTGSARRRAARSWRRWKSVAAMESASLRRAFSTAAPRPASRSSPRPSRPRPPRRRARCCSTSTATGSMISWCPTPLSGSALPRTRSPTGTSRTTAGRAPRRLISPPRLLPSRRTGP